MSTLSLLDIPDSAATGRLPWYLLFPSPLPTHSSKPDSGWGSTQAAAKVRALPSFHPQPIPPIMPHGRPPCLRILAVKQPHSTRRAHTCSPGSLAHRPVCCHGQVPTPGHSKASVQPSRWQKVGAGRGPELLLVLEVRAGWREGSLAGRQEML